MLKTVQGTNLKQVFCKHEQIYVLEPNKAKKRMIKNTIVQEKILFKKV